MKKTILAILGYLLLFSLAINVAVTAFVPDRSMDYLGYRTLLVLSDSMDPEIKVNDLVVITKINEENLEVGDIITFYVYIPELGEEALVTHYIGAIEVDEFGETIYKTHGASAEAGDYDNWRDSEGNPIDITFDDIEGSYFFKLAGVGNIIQALRNPVLLAMMVITFTIIVVTINYIRNIRDDEDDDDEYEDNPELAIVDSEE